MFQNQLVGLDHEIREETLRLNAERDEQIIALQREEKQVAASRFQRKTPSYCTGPRTGPRRTRHRSGSAYGASASARDPDGSSILSVESYGSTSNSNWVLDRASQLAAGDRYTKLYNTVPHQISDSKAVRQVSLIRGTSSYPKPVTFRG